jgi:hypothetical protein
LRSYGRGPCCEFYLFEKYSNTTNIQEELGIEGFDRLVDRYHDTAHDHAIQYGRKIPRPKRWRKNHLGQEVPVEEPRAEAQRASSETRVPPSDEPRRRGRGENDFSEGEDQGYASERPRQRPRRYSGNEPRGETTNYAQQQKVRISSFQEVRFPSVNFVDS